MPGILVIDDNERFRGYMTAFLERAGYMVLALSNGVHVEAVIAAECFDTAVADLLLAAILRDRDRSHGETFASCHAGHRRDR